MHAPMTPEQRQMWEQMQAGLVERRQLLERQLQQVQELKLARERTSGAAAGRQGSRLVRPGRRQV
jgi:hypothetical protein